MASTYSLCADCRGHEDDVRGVAVCAPDQFATCSRDKTVRVWAEAIGDDGYATRVVCVGHTSFVTTMATIPPNKVQGLPEGGVVSGGRDKRVLVWNTSTGQSVNDFEGHSLDVTAVCVLSNGQIVSGAMDKTIRVWDTTTNKCLRVIQAHESSVLALLALPTGGFLSGSADKTIKKWSDDTNDTSGKPPAVYTGHVDTVRGLGLMPGVGFLSASHDCTARLWTFGGEQVAVFAGHTALVYSVAAMSNGKVVTGSEDNSMKIWNPTDGSCVQTIMHPGCVWSVQSFNFPECSDIVTCCADSVVRVWTDVDDKKNAAAQKSLEDSLLAQQEAKAQADLASQQSKIKSEPASALLTNGTSDGQTKVIKENSGGIAAYAWSAATMSWERLGEVTGVGEGGGGKKSYQGKDYDFVFDVDIQEGAPTLKLPFNIGDNPYTSAELFLENNARDPGYREQVVNFIVQNVGEEAFSGSGANVSADPFTGGGAYVPGRGGDGPTTSASDPFTGSGAYVPGSGGTNGAISMDTSIPVSSLMKYVPVKPTQCVTFETAKFDAMLSKLKELGSTDSELTAFTVVATFANGGEAPDELSAQILVQALNEKPTETLFPLLDLCKALVVLSDETGALNDETLFTAMMSACARAAQPPSTPGNLLTAGRLFCNSFKNEKVRNIFLMNASSIFDGLASASAADVKPPVRLALATALLNFSAFSGSNNSSITEVAAQAVSCGVELLLNASSDEKDADAKFRTMVALGTFAISSSETKMLLVDLGLGDIATSMKLVGGKVGQAAEDVKIALA